MTYEYEKSLKNRLLNLELDDYVEVIQLEKEYEELEEVYAKAKAWQTFKEELLQDYVAQKQRVERIKRRIYEGYPKAKLSDIAYERGKLGQMTSELHYLDELDGTKEFSNILHDMNRSE